MVTDRGNFLARTLAELPPAFWAVLAPLAFAFGGFIITVQSDLRSFRESQMVQDLSIHNADLRISSIDEHGSREVGVLRAQLSDINNRLLALSAQLLEMDKERSRMQREITRNSARLDSLEKK